MCLSVLCCQWALAEEYQFGNGKLVVKTLAANAVRIQYVEQVPTEALPEWLYVKNEEVKSNDISVKVDAAKQSHLAAAARQYIAEQHVRKEVQFDVVSVVLEGGQAAIEYIPEAFYPIRSKY